jgi:pyruvate kinase
MEAVKERAAECYEVLSRLREQMLKREVVLPSCGRYESSCLNMQDFLTLKKYDLSRIQGMLSSLGLSSLGKAHFHLLYTIGRELKLLERILGIVNEAPETRCIGFDEAYERMKERARFLKSDDSSSFAPSVMITMPSNAADDALLYESLLSARVDLCRINTAHDTPVVWKRMADTVRRINANERQENPIKIYVDLAGPKFRTGPLKQVSASFKINPRRTESFLIVPASSHAMTMRERKEGSETISPATVVVNNGFYARLRSAGRIGMEDAEGRERKCKILSWDDSGCIVEAKKMLIDEETTLFIEQKKKSFLANPVNFIMRDEEVRLFVGDRLFVTTLVRRGEVVHGDRGFDAIISCVSADFLPFVHIGETLYIDDGLIGLEVVEKREEGVLCRVSSTKPSGAVLKSQKGINFPDSEIDIEALTETDRKNLDEVIEFADIIGISFAQRRDDVEQLKAYLAESGRNGVGIVAKIETKRAVKNLPMLLLSLIPHPHSGVMIARGDLAIEVGFEHLPRIQSEILDLCESAHIPVIYATQILENLMKKNLPSRAEIIDASSAQRADCIMLNKGPFIQHAVEVLQDILASMQRHSLKNVPQLNSVEEWKGFNQTIKNEIVLWDNQDEQSSISKKASLNQQKESR